MSEPKNKPPVGPFVRVTLNLETRKSRLDTVLLEALRNQTDNLDLKNISRTQFKELFKEKRIRIKGQPALPSSGLAAGSTDVDVMGYESKKAK